jgi:nitrogenase molybdenum-iron protein alpha/beta subunit
MRRKAQHTRMIIDAIVENRVRLTDMVSWAVRHHQGHPEANSVAGVARRAYGVKLLEHRDILGLSEEDAFRDNAAILTALQERRRAEGAKSARSATRSHRRTHPDMTPFRYQTGDD